MRKLLASTSLVVLGFAAGALAQTQDPAAPSEPAGQVQPAPGAPATPPEVMEQPGTGTAETTPPAGQPGTGTAETTPPAATSAPTEQAESPDAEMDEPSTWGSYSRSQDFQGTIAGGYSADDLIGRTIESPDGENIGEISDLLIGPNDEVSQVIVDVGGFLGIGSKSVALDIEKMTMEQGDGGSIVIPMTREEIEALPELEEMDTGWSRATEAQ